MKEFITAVEEHEYDDKDVLEFKIDGIECLAHKPTDGQIALTMASLGRYTDNETKMAGIIDFFVGVLDEESEKYIIDRLLSRTNPLPLTEVEKVLMWMMEEWVGRPIQPPSGSTQSRQNGGRKSKPRTSRSTSSVSVPASSAT